ncbi:MAG: prolyl oligopeptidase family serine peptidase [Bacteroidetes bacterium]|nr:prolyl oligopeptidase family serine peptidase [Bacteroidota bacterium]
MKKQIIFKLLMGLFLLISFQSNAQVDLKYQTPPKEILELINSPLTPSVRLDNNGVWMILLENVPFKSIDEVSALEYKLAGLRINPKTNGGSRTNFNTNITLKNVTSGEEFQITGLPEKAKISGVSWSPDYQKVAFTNTTNKGIELWYFDVQSKEAKKLTKAVLNGIFGGSYNWAANGMSFICSFINPDRGSLTQADETPTGPVVQENLGKTAPSRTYQDLLKDKADEANFDYFAGSMLVRVDLEGNTTNLTEANIYSGFSVSPNSEYIITETIKKPYSYLVPFNQFPTVLSLLDKDGKFIRVIQEIPLIEEVPSGFDAVEKGPRRVSWRSDKPASIYWVEALDEGNPKTKAEFRDAVYTTDYPFDLNNKNHIVSVKNRFRGMTWGNDKIAIAYDNWRSTRESLVYKINPSIDNIKPEILFNLNSEDIYQDPGSFVTIENQYGRNVLLVEKDRYLYLSGEGYSPEGNRPFLNQYDLTKKTTKEIWRADGISTYESIGFRGNLFFIDLKKGVMITSIESASENANYYLRNFKKKDAPKQITFFPNPYKAMEGVTKEFIKYKRADGVDLTATMYLPAGYDKTKDGRIPMLMWAYPREYKDPKTAGQVRTSPHRFTRINYGSPIFWVKRGFAILENAEFPIIGVGETEPNDLFIPQLVANAKAAIDALDEMGIVDRKRVAVGGHSYGAFMTANLLSHSDLFAAGLARSGAYNRTLTPFGFQSEERTYWEAPDVYNQMAPFMHADKMKTPLLMTHGLADNNSGTFPLQSERYYNALKGHGATVRLVMLPAESHGYASYESILHVLWESDQWLMKYVKNKK